MNFDFAVNYKGYEIKLKTKESNTYNKVEYKVIGPTNYSNSVEIHLPIVTENKVIYHGNIYANPVFGRVTDNILITGINGLDSKANETKTIGSIISFNKFNQPPINIFRIATTGQNNVKDEQQEDDIINIDNWDYCRASDILLVNVIHNTKLIIDKIIARQSVIKDEKILLRQLQISISICMKLFRYIGNIEEHDSNALYIGNHNVIFGEVLANMPNIQYTIESELIDFTNCPQSTVFSHFTLKEGVLLGEIDKTKTIKEIFKVK
jgi:hypothetical protein